MPSRTKAAENPKSGSKPLSAAKTRNASDPRPAVSERSSNPFWARTAIVVRKREVTAAQTMSSPGFPFPACPSASTETRFPAEPRVTTTRITYAPTMFSTVT